MCVCVCVCVYVCEVGREGEKGFLHEHEVKYSRTAICPNKDVYMYIGSSVRINNLSLYRNMRVTHNNIITTN